MSQEALRRAERMVSSEPPDAGGGIPSGGGLTGDKARTSPSRHRREIQRVSAGEPGFAHRIDNRVGGKGRCSSTRIRSILPRVLMNTANRDLEWLLENLLSKTPETRHVLVLSGDGLKLCHTSGLTSNQADQLAAIASGIQSLSCGVSIEFGDGTGGVRQSMTEFNGGLLFIVMARQGAHLAVIAGDEADAGLIGHNMHEMVEQIGEYLTAPPRQIEHSGQQT